jgi:arylsulfatase A-like enzyme
MNRPKRIISLIFHDAGRQFGFTGAPGAITPSVDQMASEGVSFASHFSTGTVCIPSRASLLTGKYLHSAEIAHLVHDENTLPRLMSRAGYKTKRVGFAEEKEYRSIAGRRYSEDFDLSGKELLGYDESDTASSAASYVADQIIETLKNRPDESLFIHGAFTEAHGPYNLPVTDEEVENTVLPPFLPKLPQVKEAKDYVARINKAVTQGDQAIGRILDYLRETGLDKDTLVYLTCDHGMDLPAAKQSCYDAGTGTVMLFWGNGLTPGVLTGLSSHVDIPATLCDLLDIPTPPDMRGESRLAALLGREDPGRDYVFAEVSYDNTDAPVRSIRTKTHKYIQNFNPGLPVATANGFSAQVGYELLTKIYNTPRPAVELYDLEKDPYEQNNVAGQKEYEVVQNELRAELFRLMAKDNDEILRPGSVYENPDEQFAIALWYKKEDGTFELRDPKSL